MKVRLTNVEGEVNSPLNNDREGLIEVLDEKSINLQHPFLVKHLEWFSNIYV
jgi:hypothetical protein